MPCWTIVTNSVSLKLANVPLTLKAIQAEFGVTPAQQGSTIQFIVDGTAITLSEGQASARQRSEEWLAAQVNQLKRGISKQVLRVAAQVNRWAMVQDTAATSYTLTKEY